LSLSTVQRIWAMHKLQPHRLRTFKRSRDPDFEAKLTDIVGLYMNPPAHAIVLSLDEKSQIQALDRTQPGLPPGDPGARPGRSGGAGRGAGCGEEPGMIAPRPACGFWSQPGRWIFAREWMGWRHWPSRAWRRIRSAAQSWYSEPGGPTG